MNEQNKIMQYCFYGGVLVFFVFALCYFGTSHIDRRRSEDSRARIIDSQNLNSELQRTIKDGQAKVDGTIRGLGSIEEELNRAECAITKCEQIIGTASERVQATNPQGK